jgi:hypothetical protein
MGPTWQRVLVSTQPRRQPPLTRRHDHPHSCSSAAEQGVVQYVTVEQQIWAAEVYNEQARPNSEGAVTLAPATPRYPP